MYNRGQHLKEVMSDPLCDRCLYRCKESFHVSVISFFSLHFFLTACLVGPKSKPLSSSKDWPNVQIMKLKQPYEDTYKSNTHRLFVVTLLYGVIDRSPCWQMFGTHVIMRVSSPGSPSTPSTNRGMLVKLYLFHCCPSSKLNLGTQTDIAQGTRDNSLTVCTS